MFFFAPIESSHYSAHKIIKAQLSDILYLMSKLSE